MVPSASSFLLATSSGWELIEITWRHHSFPTQLHRLVYPLKHCHHCRVPSRSKLSHAWGFLEQTWPMALLSNKFIQQQTCVHVVEAARPNSLVHYPGTTLERQASKLCHSMHRHQRKAGTVNRRWERTDMCLVAPLLSNTCHRQGIPAQRASIDSIHPLNIIDYENPNYLS